MKKEVSKTTKIWINHLLWLAILIGLVFLWVYSQSPSQDNSNLVQPLAVGITGFIVIIFSLFLSLENIKHSSFSLLRLPFLIWRDKKSLDKSVINKNKGKRVFDPEKEIGSLRFLIFIGCFMIGICSFSSYVAFFYWKDVITAIFILIVGWWSGLFYLSLAKRIYKIKKFEHKNFKVINIFAGNWEGLKLFLKIVIGIVLIYALFILLSFWLWP